MTAPSQTNHTWTFVPSLADKQSWLKRPFINHIYRLSEIHQSVVGILNPSQIRGMVRFKTHLDLVKKMNVDSLAMGDEICCPFTCGLHLDTIIRCCDRLAIPPSAIHSVMIFDCGYFIH